MSTTTYDTRTQLLRAIALHPDEDTPRLMYADCIEETGEPSDRARAEFVRVQVELDKDRGRICPFTIHHPSEFKEDKHRHVMIPPYIKAKEPCGTCPVCVRLDRERELRTTWESTWRRQHPRKVGDFIRCEFCGTEQPAQWTKDVEPNTSGVICYACGRDVSGYPGEWHRGMLVYKVPFAGVGTDNWTGAKTGSGWDFYSPWFAWACDAVREGASFRVTGRTPETYRAEGKYEFFWKHENKSDGPGDLTTLPDLIWDSELISMSIEGSRNNRSAVVFKSPELAHLALDRAVLKLVSDAAYPKEEDVK